MEHNILGHNNDLTPKQFKRLCDKTQGNRPQLKGFIIPGLSMVLMLVATLFAVIVSL